VNGPLWVIAACMVLDRLLSLRELHAKGRLPHPVKRLRERNKPERKALSVTEMP